MLIKKGLIVNNVDPNIKQFTTNKFEVYYKGLVFIAGKKAGEESVKFIYENILQETEPDFTPIFGNYFVYIIDKVSNTQYFFTDNSGLFKCFHSSEFIATSFLELIKHSNNFSVNDLNLEAIAEFFHYGFPYFKNTLINGIERIGANSYFKIKDGKKEIKSKNLETINGQTEIDISQFFKALNYSLSNKKLSLDLTGGLDSRLILSFFSKNKNNFELAISGLKHNDDIKIAAKIAAKIKKVFFPTFHNVVEYSHKHLEAIFYLSDSQIDVVDYHRNHQLNMDRANRQIDIQISGVGGELYKDFWWLQDFPFYNKKSPDLEKLYNLRIESSSFPHHILGEKVKEHSAKLKQETINKLKGLTLDSNTKTYDNIYFNYKMQTNAGVYISLANNYFISYAPLLELELVKLAFNLKRSTRFFNNYHRKLISENTPELSTIRTTEGNTCSNSLFYKTTDIAFYVCDKAKRLGKQLLRKLLNKTYLQDSPNDNRIYSICKNSEIFKENLVLLQKHNIINSNVELKNIPNRMVGKIITLGLLIEKIEN